MKFILSLLMVPLFCLCSVTTTTAQQYPFQSYTEIDGLPNSAVYDLTQDDLGQMWFATRAGLVSYDGQQWTMRNRIEGLPDVLFGRLERDDLGRIWTVTARPHFQLAYRQNKQWVMLPQLAIDSPTADITDLKLGRRSDGTLLAAIATDDGYVCIWDGQQWRQIAESAVFDAVQALLFHRNQLFIAATNGLFAVDLTNWQLLADPLPGLPNKTIRTIAAAEPEGPLWLVGDHWLGQYDGEKFKLLRDQLDLPLPLRRAGVKALVDQIGGLYFGDDSSLYYYNTQTGRLEVLGTASGYGANGLGALFEDREGNIWFSNLRGIRKLESRRFAQFNSINGLFKDEVSAILFRKSGPTVLGHLGGLTFLTPQTSTLTLPGNNEFVGRAMSLAEDQDGSIWIAYNQPGLIRITTTGDLTTYNMNDGVPRPAFAVHVDDTNQVWVGTNNGLYKRHGERFSLFPLPGMKASDPITPIRNILPGRDGSILVVAATHGVYRIQGDQIQRWQANSRPDESYYAACEQPDGQLFVGTSHGLYQTQGQELVKTSAPGPVINRAIYSVTADLKGQFWFGTDAGVYLWHGKHLRRFAAQEGLLGSETNRDALHVDDQDRVWIGTDRGLSIYTPEFDIPPQSDPIVEFLNFEVDGSTHKTLATNELDSPPHSLSVHYRGISFRNNHHLGISTWLENFEDTWQPPQPWAQRVTRYTNLPPGRYRLHLRVESPNGPVGETVTLPEIHIPQPFWLRWWFVLLEIGAGLAILRIALAYYANKRYAKRLDTEIRVRTQELRVSEQNARYESQRFSATLNSVSECVLTLDADKNIVLCNPAAKVVLGQTTDDLLGQHVTDILPDFPRFMATTVRQHEYNNPERGLVWLETTSAPITSDTGQPAGTVLVLRDVTTRRQQDDELVRNQKLESLGLLAGGIAHDFNNLLTIIQGNIELAKIEPNLPPASLTHIDSAGRASVRAGSLAEQLLTFARGGAPQQQLTSLADVIQQAASLAFSGTTHTWQGKIAPDLWPVNVDPGQMSQVFSNIFINATQAMSAGGAVNISGKNLKQAPPPLSAGPVVMVEIRDDGEGIPEANLAKIFDPYFTTKEKGSGLGLATAFSIIKRHHGFMTVESADGEGTSFRIYLPRSDGQPTTENKLQAFPISGAHRILVMDDEADVRLLLQEYLTKMGLEAVLTSNGHQAIDTYVAAEKAGQHFAAILCDLTVPGEMGGKETIAHLRKFDPQIKAIVISGYSHDTVMSDYRNHGFTGALSKPFNYQSLALILAEVLDSDNEGTTTLSS